MTYKVVGNVYRVLEEQNAYEYIVTLYDDGEQVDEWNSLFECYTVHHSHLTHESAVEAVQEITEDVHDGNVSDWFDCA
jgi:hypothetical protein